MKRRDFLKHSLTFAGGAAVLMVPKGWTPALAQDKVWTVGFSQVTTIEPWRVQFNKDIEAEAALHKNVKLLVADAEDKTEKQVADVQNFIRQQVDLLLISPKESAGLTPVVIETIDAGIPVIVLDRNVETDKIKQWIGGDNVVIGDAVAAYALEQLGGAGKASGNIVEIWGGLGTQAAHDRAKGIHEVLGKEAGVKFLLEQQSGDWKQDQAYDIMATALRAHEKIDLVYGHNDPMAYGAYLAAKDVGREKEIKFLGVDALPNEGVRWVYNGELAATFLYPTPGAEGLRQAIKLLSGETIEPKIVLGTETVTKENAEAILKKNGLL